MTLEKSRVVYARQRNGFEKDVDGAHIIFACRTLNGGWSLKKRFVSHGSKSKDLHDHLITQTARQVKPPKKKSEQLVSCPLKQAEYEKSIECKL